MKIKKGKLNYDQSGRAYPPNPRVKENWDCIWEYEGKYYKLVGDNEHKEWDEVNIYNQIIDEAYENYCKSFDTQSEIESHSFDTDPMTKIVFVEKIKNLDWFSERWGLKLEERELSLEERCELGYKYVDPFEWDMLMGGGQEGDEGNCNDYNIPTKLITLTHNNETIESYE